MGCRSVKSVRVLLTAEQPCPLLEEHCTVIKVWGECGVRQFTLITVPPSACAPQSCDGLRVTPQLYAQSQLPHTSSQVPPLRVRPGDVRDYSRHILAGINNGSGARPRDLSLDAAKRLESYTWPGNVTVRAGGITGSGARPRELSLDAAKRLESYTWPGDVTVRGNWVGGHQVEEMGRVTPAWAYV